MRIRTEVGSDPQVVVLDLVARGAARPPADGIVEQVLLHVLGYQPGEERLTLRPLLYPPSACDEGVVQHVHGCGRVHVASAEVVQHKRPGSQHDVVRHDTDGASNWALGWHTGAVRPLLELIALGPGDAAGAVEGGADRLEVVADMDADGLTPSVDTVRDLKRECDLPLRVMLRGHDGFSTSGSELSRLKGAASQLAAAGADGFVFGFLGLSADVDVETTMGLAAAIGGLPWTFHRAIDHALDHDRAWEQVPELTGLDTVLTAGSARGVGDGLDDLCRRATNSAEAAELIMAGGGLAPEHVPWLARAGVRKFHVGSRVRPGGSFRAYIDPHLVRSWRSLVDDAVAAAL